MATIDKYWRKYLKSNNLPSEEKYTDAWPFGNNSALSNDILDLILQGKKTTTADLLGEHLVNDWSELPPIIIHTGDEELLKDDTIRVEEKAREEGTTVETKIFPRMWHVWQINSELPETKQSLDEISSFLEKYLDNE